MSIIAVGPRAAGDETLEHFGWTALSSAREKHAEGDHVTVIEHPDADYKQIALRENQVIGRGKGGVTLYYSADTLHGSSGSPVFSDEFMLVALHHAGGRRNDTVLENGEPVPEDCTKASGSARSSTRCGNAKIRCRPGCVTCSPKRSTRRRLRSSKTSPAQPVSTPITWR